MWPQVQRLCSQTGEAEKSLASAARPSMSTTCCLAASLPRTISASKMRSTKRLHRKIVNRRVGPLCRNTVRIKIAISGGTTSEMLNTGLVLKEDGKPGTAIFGPSTATAPSSSFVRLHIKHLRLPRSAKSANTGRSHQRLDIARALDVQLCKHVTPASNCALELPAETQDHPEPLMLPKRAGSRHHQAITTCLAAPSSGLARRDTSRGARRAWYKIAKAKRVKREPSPHPDSPPRDLATNTRKAQISNQIGLVTVIAQALVKSQLAPPATSARDPAIPVKRCNVVNCATFSEPQHHRRPVQLCFTSQPESQLRSEYVAARSSVFAVRPAKLKNPLASAARPSMSTTCLPAASLPRTISASN